MDGNFGNFSQEFISSEPVQKGGQQKESSKSNKEYDFKFKIVLVGDSGVGKSCTLLRFADDKFNENFYATVGVDFRFKSLNIDDKYLRVQIWDTAGQERFKTVTSAYYKGADGVMMVYDVTDKSSFDHILEWNEEIDRIASSNPYKIVLGNKCDLENKVTDNDKKSFTERTGIEIHEVSAKSSYQVEYVFEKMIRTLMERAIKDNKPQYSQTKRKLESSSSSNSVGYKKNKNCCL